MLGDPGGLLPNYYLPRTSFTLGEKSEEENQIARFLTTAL